MLNKVVPLVKPNVCKFLHWLEDLSCSIKQHNNLVPFVCAALRHSFQIVLLDTQVKNGIYDT